MSASFKGYLAEPQSADEQAKIEEYIQVLRQKSIRNFIILKRNPSLNFTILNKNPPQTFIIYPHKHHHLEQNLKPFDYLQIADGGTLGLSAWWLGGNDMHQEGAWSWPRWKLRFIFYVIT